MRSWRSEAPAFLRDSDDGFTAYPSSLATCTIHGLVHNDTMHNRSTCLPAAQVVWEPDQWVSDVVHERPSLPAEVTLRHLEKACDGISVHVAKSEWVDAVRKGFHSKYGPKSWSVTGGGGTLQHHADLNSRNNSASAARRARRVQCVERLQSFTPRVCSLRNVLVWGHARRMMSADGSRYFIPPEAQAEQRAHDLACPANCHARPHNVVACGGHVS